MSKIVKPSYATSRKGVDSFALYCSSYKPIILWREETVNDFGIDGEIELTANNQEGKLEATGEILKVQIKSTSSYESYMKNETPSSFEFYARLEDIEYWNRHKLDVLLVIYDDKVEKLYAKKITKSDYQIQTYKKKTLPIVFDKSENALLKGESNFLEKFSLQPKSRLSFDNFETLSSNIFLIKKYPKELFAYDAKISAPKDAYDKLERKDYPVFAMYSKKVYTFSNLQQFPIFKETCIDFTKKDTFNFNQLQIDINTRNHYIELLKRYLKDFFYSYSIYFNKDYTRFYFGKPANEDVRKIRHKTRKRGIEGERTVVSKHTYGKDTFYKHWAFEIDFLFKNEFFLIINPKYLFTLDGKEPLEPKKITRYTNALTAMEYNGHILDYIHFYFDLFSKGKHEIEINNPDGISFSLSKYIQLSAPFSIPMDTKHFKKREEQAEALHQTKLDL